MQKTFLPLSDTSYLGARTPPQHLDTSDLGPRTPLLQPYFDTSDLGSRTLPPQFNTPDLGSPKKVWSLLCDKDEHYRRDPKIFTYHPKVDPKMRAMLIEWVMEVCADRHLHRETFHLSVDYLDRYLAKMRGMDPSKLQLTASTALVIATKIEEIYPPKVSEIAEFTDGCCTEQEIRDLEEAMLQTLDWNFIPYTAIHWLALFLQMMNTNETNCGGKGSVSTRDIESLSDGHFSTEFWPTLHRCTVPKLMRDEFIRLAMILDLSLLDIQSLKFKYSELAAALIHCCYEPESFICQITGFSTNDLQDARDFMEPFVNVCEKLEFPGTVIPCFSNIPSDTRTPVISEDRHNIQTYTDNSMELLEEVQKLGEALESRRNAAKLTGKGKRSRKRKFGVVSTNHC